MEKDKSRDTIKLGPPPEEVQQKYESMLQKEALSLMDEDVEKVVNFLAPLELKDPHTLATVLVENGLVNPVVAVARLRQNLAPVLHNIWYDVTGEHEGYDTLVGLYQNAPKTGKETKSK